MAQRQPKSANSSSPTVAKVKPSYKHVPHSQKPAHLVQKRNERERRRVQAVNQAFYRLRKCVPIENRNKRVSKVKTLQRAIDYIRKLRLILEASDADQVTSTSTPAASSSSISTATSTSTATSSSSACTTTNAAATKREQASSSRRHRDYAIADSSQSQQQQQQQQPLAAKQQPTAKPPYTSHSQNQNPNVGHAHAHTLNHLMEAAPVQSSPSACPHPLGAPKEPASCATVPTAGDVLRESSAYTNVFCEPQPPQTAHYPGYPDCHAHLQAPSSEYSGEAVAFRESPSAPRSGAGAGVYGGSRAFDYAERAQEVPSVGPMSYPASHYNGSNQQQLHHHQNHHYNQQQHQHQPYAGPVHYEQAPVGYHTSYSSPLEPSKGSDDYATYGHFRAPQWAAGSGGFADLQQQQQQQHLHEPHQVHNHVRQHRVGHHQEQQHQQQHEQQHHVHLEQGQLQLEMSHEQQPELELELQLRSSPTATAATTVVHRTQQVSLSSGQDGHMRRPLLLGCSQQSLGFALETTKI